MKFVKGPDFPTGGILVESEENIRQAYLSGKGGFRLRATYEIEREKGGQWQVSSRKFPIRCKNPA